MNGPRSIPLTARLGRLLHHYLGRPASLPLVLEGAQEYTRQVPGVEPVVPQRVDDLLHQNPAVRKGWVAAWQRRAGDFENILRRLHLFRLKDEGRLHGGKFRQFLTMGYLNTGDVRYFNEFLWLEGIADTVHLPLHLLEFSKNCDEKGCHRYPVANLPSPVSWAEKIKAGKRTENGDLKKTRVGLLGHPSKFSNLAGQLETVGCQISGHDIPYSPHSMIHRIKSHRGLWKALCFLSGNHRPWSHHPYSTSREQAALALQSENLDVGVHQLGFVIRAPLIQAFSKGILNDHWGLLPYVRGRSSLEYSLLFGFPMGATIHWVDEGVDTGSILSFYPVSHGPISSLAALHSILDEGRDARFYSALLEIASGRAQWHPNEISQGLQFYEMHPLLMEYVEKVHLPPAKV